MNLNSCIFKNDIFCLSGKYEVILTDYEISHVARREIEPISNIQWSLGFAQPKWSSGDTGVKCPALARREVKCATHARRHFTMRSIASRTKGALMKTKSSYRTLPLIPQVEEVLLAEKKKQEEGEQLRLQSNFRLGYIKYFVDIVLL